MKNWKFQTFNQSPTLAPSPSSQILDARPRVRENPRQPRAIGPRAIDGSSRCRPMAHLELVPLDRPEVKPLPISPRLRTQLVYFMSTPGTLGVPALGQDEYWFAQ